MRRGAALVLMPRTKPFRDLALTRFDDQASANSQNAAPSECEAMHPSQRSMTAIANAINSLVSTSSAPGRYQDQRLQTLHADGRSNDDL